MPTSVQLVTPGRILFDGEASFAVLRADGGEIMFLPDHAPFIAAADIGVLRIAQDEGDEYRAAVHGGFVRVASNRVLVLASVAEPADEIDVARARRALDAAEGAISSGEGGSEAAERQEREHAEGGEQVEQSPVMKAMLYPDDPEVAVRRAEARLEAAGALEQSR